MTIWEISEKAEYIAQRHQQLQDQWHLYCNSLVQGITLSKEGDDFLGYARQVLEQAAILEDKYKGNPGGKKQFCVCNLSCKSDCDQ